MAIGAIFGSKKGIFRQAEKQAGAALPAIGAAMPTICLQNSNSAPQCWEVEAMALEIGFLRNKACFGL